MGRRFGFHEILRIEDGLLGGSRRAKKLKSKIKNKNVQNRHLKQPGKRRSGRNAKRGEAAIRRERYIKTLEKTEDVVSDVGDTHYAFMGDWDFYDYNYDDRYRYRDYGDDDEWQYHPQPDRDDEEAVWGGNGHGWWSDESELRYTGRHRHEPAPGSGAKKNENNESVPRECGVCCEELVETDLTHSKPKMMAAPFDLATQSFLKAVVQPRDKVAAPLVPQPKFCESDVPFACSIGREELVCRVCMIRNLQVEVEKAPALSQVYHFACPRCFSARLALDECIAFVESLLSCGVVTVGGVALASLFDKLQFIVVKNTVIRAGIVEQRKRQSQKLRKLAMAAPHDRNNKDDGPQETLPLLLRQCLNDECSAFLFIDTNESRCSLVTCPECSFHQCFVCQCKYHFGFSCRKNLSQDAALLVKHETTRPCPMCKTPIEKNFGCSHMKCGFCQIDFWWTQQKDGLWLPRGLSSRVIYRRQVDPEIDLLRRARRKKEMSYRSALLADRVGQVKPRFVVGSVFGPSIGRTSSAVVAVGDEAKSESDDSEESNGQQTRVSKRRNRNRRWKHDSCAESARTVLPAPIFSGTIRI